MNQKKNLKKMNKFKKCCDDLIFVNASKEYEWLSKTDKDNLLVAYIEDMDSVNYGEFLVEDTSITDAFIHMQKNPNDSEIKDDFIKTVIGVAFETYKDEIEADYNMYMELYIEDAKDGY